MQCDEAARGTRLWILRHGRSTLNDSQKFQGCGAASELTIEGVRSAEAAGTRLKYEAIDAIYSSPLRRAMQTAELVAAALENGARAPKLETREALREIELPAWEGLTFAAVRERSPEQFRQFRECPEEFTLPDAVGEERWPVLEMEQRVHHFLSELIRVQAGRNILLVTHGGPARIILLAALRLHVRCLHSVQVSHGGLSCVAVDRWPDRMKLEVLNELSHWEAKLPKVKDGKDGLRLLLVASDTPQSEAEGEETLARMFEDLPIHRILAAGQDGVTAAMRLLRYRRRSTIETCTEPGLLGNLLRQLSRYRAEGLVNLLVTARGELLSQVLKQLMRWDALGMTTSVGLCKGLSVVHLPRSTAYPVLQALNTCRAPECFAGGTR